jgi:hypothetical protein
VNDWSLAAGLVAFGTVPVYLYVGDRLRRRPVPDRARLPSLQFTVWWWGLAASSALGGIGEILWAFRSLTLPLDLTLEILSVLVGVAFLWGLVGYLTYLYTGTYHLIGWTVFYAAFFVAVVYYEFALVPIGVTAMAGVPTLVDARSAASLGLLTVFVVFSLLVPEFAGIVLYASLLRRTRDRTLRYRIAFVSLGLAIFLGSDIAPSPTPLVPAVAWTLVKAVIEVGASLIVLVAYFPPARLQRALRIEPMDAIDGRAPEG